MLGSITVCQLAGLLGLAFTDRAADSWYDRLEKPAFNPPDWVFGPAWTLLYALIGVALWLILRHRPSPERTTALALFALQLALNAAWTPIFFGAQDPTAALVEIVVLVFVLAVTVVSVWRVDRRAAWLMLPYLAWVTFATVLNGSVVALN
ncbi:MAG: TspO/MBR family protein [Acidimicrobiia bacterium]